MLITYANKLCKLMSGQIDKMSDQNEDLKGHVLLKKKNYFQPWFDSRPKLLLLQLLYTRKDILSLLSDVNNTRDHMTLICLITVFLA